MSLPWTEKYKPTNISQVVGNDKAVAQLVDFLKNWRRHMDKKALLLYGSPGNGKTVSVYAAANDLDLEIVEVNASDKRNLEIIQRTVGSAATMSSLFPVKGKVILIDEIDGLSGVEDRGGVGAIISVIRNSEHPIVLTANNPWDPKFLSLRQYCYMIPFNKIRTPTISKVLGRISELEGVRVDDSVLEALANNSEGDLRAAINDLQALSQNKTELTMEDVALYSRDKIKSIFEVLAKVFRERDAREIVNEISSTDVDYEMMIHWINENISQHMSEPKELSNAYNMISRADVFLGRIRNRQHWGLLSYVFELMSAGVSLSREVSKAGYVKYQFPSWIRNLSRTRSTRSKLSSIGMRIGSKCHISSSGGVEYYLPYLEVIFKADPKIAAKISKWFEFEDELIEKIAGDKKTYNKIIKELKE
ncbi:MAG: replication factor C large subunit [Candidatus Jordarchaeum sp.]|uniref:replication factor C large subunit n=1 Tax=Candidatus Jordarchaeum sp. TaxID=2823881 RepID=UPI0040499521